MAGQRGALKRSFRVRRKATITFFRRASAFHSATTSDWPLIARERRRRCGAKAEITKLLGRSGIAAGDSAAAWVSSAKQAAGKVSRKPGGATWAEARITLNDVRGAEALLFHGTAGIGAYELFRRNPFTEFAENIGRVRGGNGRAFLPLEASFVTDSSASAPTCWRYSSWIPPMKSAIRST